jgi:hypothetical protein
LLAARWLCKDYGTKRRAAIFKEEFVMIESVAPIPFEHVVSTAFDQGEGVLVDLNSKQYYQLNETAMFVWTCLEKRASLPEIINGMTETYDVSAQHAAASVEKILKHFADRRLVHAP